MVERATKKERYAYDPDYLTEPGEVLLETIESLGMSQKELAARTGYSTKHINLLISGKARLTAESALRLEKVTGVPARFWNNLETQYQERKARLVNRQSAGKHLAWLKEIPTKELIKRGAISEQETPAALLEATLSFFGVASTDAWHAGWSERQIAFRKSPGADHCSGGIATWVRLAELEAQKMECPPFDAGKFKTSLETIRSLTAADPDIFVPTMRKLCMESGVAFVLVPEIPKAPVNGAARWLTPQKAMIALNLRGKSNDKFWFTFFHEAGHILNDNRDEVFVDVAYADDPRERSANEFAADLLVPKQHADLLKQLKSGVAVTNFAQRIGIHPAIVVGRLQHDRILSYANLNGLKVKLVWAEK